MINLADDKRIPNDWMSKVHWQAIGVFPTKENLERDDGPQDWNNFVYTVGLLPGLELVASCQSVEGVVAPHQLICSVLNMVGHCFLRGILSYGDEFIFPMGVPDSDDVDTVWWIGQREEADKYQVNASKSQWCVPLKWSTPLGAKR